MSLYCEACAEPLGDGPTVEAWYVRNDRPPHAPIVTFHATCWAARRAPSSWYMKVNRAE